MPEFVKGFFWERFRLKENLKGRGKKKKKKSNTRRPQSLLWKTLGGRNRPPSDGAVAQPLEGGSQLQSASRARLSRRRHRRGGTPPRLGAAGRDPLFGRALCGGRPRQDEVPEEGSGACAARGAGPAARSGGSGASSAPRALRRGLGCQPGAESGSQVRLRAPQTASRLLPQPS